MASLHQDRCPEPEELPMRSLMQTKCLF